MSGEPRSAIGIREVQVYSGAVSYSKTSFGGASSFFGERVLIAIPRCSERQSIEMANSIMCVQTCEHTAKELPDWANKVFEELRASTVEAKNWKTEKWERTMVIGELKVKGDAKDGEQPGCISVPAAQYMVTMIRHVGNRQRVAAVWAICCNQELFGEILQVMALLAADGTEWERCCTEWHSVVLRGSLTACPL